MFGVRASYGFVWFRSASMLHVAQRSVLFCVAMLVVVALLRGGCGAAVVVLAALVVSVVRWRWSW